MGLYHVGNGFDNGC